MAASRRTGKGGEGAAAQAPRRRGRGFRHAGAAARPGIAPVAEKMGFAESDVLIRWTEIAGEALAALCHPVKVSYGRGATLGATLTVRAEGAIAPEVEHLAPRIVERVNSFYGYRAVSRLRITQATGMAGELRGFAEETSGFDGPSGRARPADAPWRGDARPPAPATPAATEEAARLAEGIRSPALRDALTRLGGFVLSRPPKTRPTE